MIEICGMHLCLYKDINMVHFISIYGIILENGLNITITYISTMKTKINGLFNAKQLQVVLKLPFLLLLLALTLVACRDNENEDRPESDLFGLWQPYKMTQTATLSTGPYSVSTEYSICEQKGRILFTDDGLGNAKTYSEANGPCILQDDSNFTYTYDAVTNTLVITSANGTSQTGSIKELSESNLVYELVGSYDFQGEQDVTVTTTVTARKTKD